MDRKGKISFLVDRSPGGSSVHLGGGKSITTQTDESCLLLRNQKYGAHDLKPPSGGCQSCRCCPMAYQQQQGQFIPLAMPWFSAYPPAYAGGCLSLGMPPFIPMPMYQGVLPYGLPNPSARGGTDRMHNLNGESSVKLNAHHHHHHHSDDAWKPTAPIKSEPNFADGKKYGKRYITELLNHCTPNGRYKSDTAIQNNTNNKNKNKLKEFTDGGVRTQGRYYKGRDRASDADATRIDYSCSEILSASSVYKYADMRMHELTTSLQDINENIAKLSNKAAHLGPAAQDSAAGESSYLHKGVYGTLKRSRISPLMGGGGGRKEQAEDEEEESKRYNRIVGRSSGGYGEPLRTGSSDALGNRSSIVRKTAKPLEENVATRFPMSQPISQQVPVRMKPDDQQTMKRKARHQPSEEDKKVTTANISFSIKYDPKTDKTTLVNCCPPSETAPKCEGNLLRVVNKDEHPDRAAANSALQAQRDHQQSLIHIENWLENNVVESTVQQQAEPPSLRRQSQYNSLEVLSKISEEDEDECSSSSNSEAVNRKGKGGKGKGNGKAEGEQEEAEEEEAEDEEEEDAMFHHMNRKERDHLYLEQKPGNTWIR